VATFSRRPDTRKGTPWLVRVYLPGGGHECRTFYSEREARRWAASMEGDKAKGSLPSNLAAGRVTLREWSAEWLSSRNYKVRTREERERLLRNWILPELGEVPLSKLTPQRVRQWHSKSLERVAAAGGRGEYQVPAAYRLLHAMFETAVAEEFVARNPCRIPGAGREPQRERQLLEPEQVWALAERMGELAPHLRAFVVLAMFGGLRHGELRGLERRDVNLLTGTVRVERTLDARRDRVGTPKSDAGTRTVTLPPFLVAELEAHLEGFTPAEPDARVFRGDKGGPLPTRTVYKWWHRAREDCGLPWARIHDSRHFAGTTYAGLGSSVRELQSFGGWSTPNAALRYMHAAERRKTELADRLEAFAEATRDGRESNVLDLTRAQNARETAGGGGG
jgi:integrase